MTNPGVRVTVAEVEARLLAIYFELAPDVAEERFSYLQRGLLDWLREHPQRLVTDTEVVRSGGQVVMLVATVVAKSSAVRPSAWIDVDQKLMDRLGKEYMEAVMVDASGFLANRTIGGGNKVLMMNRREVAILVERQTERIFIVAAEHARSKLTAAQIKSFESWRDGRDFGYWCLFVSDEFTL